MDGEERRAMHEEKEYEKGRERERKKERALCGKRGGGGRDCRRRARPAAHEHTDKGEAAMGRDIRERERGENRSGPPIKYAGP